MPQTPSQRAAANRAKGVRFEREIARRFRAAGWPCKRVLEYDGYSHGWDLALDDCPGVVIQCKNTKRATDIFRGLDEAVAHNPGKKLYICIHRSRRTTRILATEPTSDGMRTTTLLWDDLLEILKRTSDFLCKHAVSAEVAHMALSYSIFNIDHTPGPPPPAPATGSPAPIPTLLPTVAVL